eukprot:c20699_g1_i1 orf=573-1364(-)
MLGNRTRPLLHTTSKSSLLFGDECGGEAANALVGGKYLFPPPSFHHHIVVGFDAVPEIKPSDACESPRSVLDVNVLPLQKQVAAWCLRSCLRRLPLQKKGNQGVGLAAIVDIQAEEEENYGFLAHADCHAMSASSRSRHQQRSQPIAIVANPRMLDHHSVNKGSKYVYSSPKQSQDENVSSVQSVLDFFGSDEMSPWQECVLHDQLSCDVANDENYTVNQSIFSVSSVPSNCCSSSIRSRSFLDACVFCQRIFSPGKDIFMYR